MSAPDVKRWDTYFRELRVRDTDLDWSGRWTDPFLDALEHAQTILELGCGTGNDAARLAAHGHRVTATDLSPEAITQAKSKYDNIDFRVLDMTGPLPFADASFDAVMSNVAVHAFDDQ